MNIAVVIPVFNHLTYTRGCLACLQPERSRGLHLIVIDNGSTDGTSDWLADQADVTVVRNNENRGCAPAWNQGVVAAISAAGSRLAVAGRLLPDRCELPPPRADWVVILNNDVLLPEGWLPALLGAAERHGLDIVCPAMRERDLNYDFVPYARDFMGRLATVVRRDGAHGVCFAVKRAVFESVGRFDERFRIGQYEDADFFRRARAAGFKTGIVGASFIHHFGSVTQDSLDETPANRSYETQNRAYFKRKWKLNWWRRRWEKTAEWWRRSWWRMTERARFGHTLHEKWKGGILLLE